MTTATSGAASLTTPAGYTSRFVAHVDHGQTHQASLSNSNNPHDRNRFRTFLSDEHDEPSTDRVEDYEYAAKSADYDIHGADGSMVKPQSNKRNHTDDSTDTDETITSSSSSSATTVRFESLEGSGYDGRVENRTGVEQHPLMEGRSGNDVNSSLTDRRIDDPGRGSFARPPPPADRDDGHHRPDEITSWTTSQAAPSAHHVTTDSGGGSETESSDEEGGGRESRDENSNVRDKKTENRGVDRGHDSSEDETTDSGDKSDRAPSDSHFDNSYGGYEDIGVKRPSSSILEEKSIEELFDDNGWVITEQDLQPGSRQTVSKSFQQPDSSEETRGDVSASYFSSVEEKGRGNEDVDAASNEVETSGNAGSIVSRCSQSASRRYVGESSIGKNGWMMSDESESESERTVSPMENSTRSGDTGWERSNGASVDVEDDERRDRDGPSSMRAEESDGKGGIGAENSWTGDENGWVMILNKVNDSSDGKEGESMDETSTIRSQTTDLVARTNVENGALVANATQSKETESCNEHEDTPGVDITIPMQMVTTVFCVSVLCYSVLINLFL